MGLTPRLIELLSHKDATIRRFAVSALGQIGDPKAIPALKRVAETDPARHENGVYGVREAAREAIRAINEGVNSGRHEQPKGDVPGRPSAAMTFGPGIFLLFLEEVHRREQRGMAAAERDRPARDAPFQFRLRTLLLLMLATSVVCGLLRTFWGRWPAAAVASLAPKQAKTFSFFADRYGGSAGAQSERYRRRAVVVCRVVGVP